VRPPRPQAADADGAEALYAAAKHGRAEAVALLLASGAAVNRPRSGDQVRKPPSLPRSWANFSPFQPYFYSNAWANLHLLGPT
jgi:hypothetical protein